MNRSEDASLIVVLLQRVGDLGVRVARRQSDFSAVSALLTAALSLTLLTDVAVGHLHYDRVTILSCLVGFALLSVIPVWAGHRYPRWAGIAVVGALAVWSAYSVFQTTHAQTELSPLFELTMIALYVGWFYRPAIARLALMFNVLVILLAMLGRVEPTSSGYSSEIAFAYAVLISVFCLEAGSYLRRRALARANYDPLTGVLNRRGLAGHAARAIADAKRTGEPLTVVVVDFDDFKAVNDAGGHAAGDRALRTTANIWTQGLGKKDLVARTGGDEFLLLIHADRDTAHTRLCEIAQGAPYSWSWGVTQLRSDDTLDELMSRADVRMYAAKGQREPGDT
ncbi:GGDEF domain-containing protein [Leucobacter sp. W1478]|uniref:GGDEF domain-containing protein n=1 Tax=Leucobacter sp. W1478 TaxID=3439065 RepID=UPI003F3DE630